MSGTHEVFAKFLSEAAETLQYRNGWSAEEVQRFLDNLEEGDLYDKVIGPAIDLVERLFVERTGAEIL